MRAGAWPAADARRYFKDDPEPLCDFYRTYGIGMLQVTSDEPMCRCI